MSNNDLVGDDAHSGSSHTNHEDPLISSSRATKTTIETLMDTLKKLEEEEKLPAGRKDKNKTPSNWCKLHQMYYSMQQQNLLAQ